MESTQPTDGRREAEIALAQAQAARTRMAGNLVLPSFFHTSIGAAIAVQIGTGAIAFGVDKPAAWVALVAGVGVFALAAGLQLARFRRLDGVWIGGLAGRVVLGTANLTSFAYATAFAAATWAAFDRQWWLVPVPAVLGGAAYAWLGERWWRSYQGDPAQRRRDDSRAVLLLVPVVAAAGLVAVLIGR